MQGLGVVASPGEGVGEVTGFEMFGPGSDPGSPVQSVSISPLAYPAGGSWFQWWLGQAWQESLPAAVQQQAGEPGGDLHPRLASALSLERVSSGGSAEPGEQGRDVSPNAGTALSPLFPSPDSCFYPKAKAGFPMSHSNFQASAIFETSESTDTEAVKTESTLGTSVTACKKVLCNSTVFESSEYWLRSEKTLCRLSFVDNQHDRGCTTICFVNLDKHTADRHDDSCIKKLSSVSPDLPKLVESLGVRQPKENEILLFSGLESPDSRQSDQAQTQSQRVVDVCLVQCASRRHPAQPASIIFEINKFLIGLQSGQERQRHGRLAGQNVADDDTNRSVSSIEEDFLTASEHLGEDSEDDPFRNDVESGDMMESVSEIMRAGGTQYQRRSTAEREDSEDSETLCASATSQKLSRTSVASTRGSSTSPRPVSRHAKESAGHYATNLAESVIQDAFIRLSQDETSFTSEAAMSVSSIPQNAALVSHSIDEPPRARTCSFELPKIVIVQSPDNCEEAAEWPGTQSHGTAEHHCHPYDIVPQAYSHRASPTGHGAKPVEVALACAASVIGTISTPQVTEHLTLESGEEDEEEDEEEGFDDHATDYSLSSAVCSMAQVAGAVAIVDLAEEAGDAEDSTEMYSASRGLLSAAQASTAIPLHCSVAESTSVDTFRANVAEVLLWEASAVLTHKQHYASVAHFLESTHNKIVDGIINPKRPLQEQLEVDSFAQDMANSIFKYALGKALKRKELEGPGKDAPDIQDFLMDSVNNLLFDVLCVTSTKISDISKSTLGSLDRHEGNISSIEHEAVTKPAREAISQLQCLTELSQPDNHTEKQSNVDKLPSHTGKREQRHGQEENVSESNIKEQCKHPQSRLTTAAVREPSDLQGQLGKCISDSKLPSVESSPLHGPRDKPGRDMDGKQQPLSSSSGAQVALKMDGESRTHITCFADDLATTVVSMATELAAICLENSSGKQPWFCALKGTTEGPDGLLLPCRTSAALRRKEVQNGAVVAKKHRPPRLSEIKRKTEEQPELMERLVNRVVDETVNLDEPAISDPFALFASEVTARIMNCPELNVVDTSKPGQSSRSRLQCERWSSRGKASSYESIPEEDVDPAGTANTLGPGSRLGHNLSRGSSISKQSSCESITDEFSRFMVNQMETEGRGFDLLLDYYAGKNASSILAAAVQQAASKKNGHLNVRTSSCLSKQSSTESITEEFYRFMLKDMDKENKDYGLSKTKEWSNSLLPPSPRTPFCIRQSSVPDRRSSDSRLTVNSPIKANSFDGFARNIHGDSLNIYPTNTVSATGLCKSDSCLYQRGQTDQITDMLIHETWASSIESLMRKNKIIAEPSEESLESEAPSDSQPHVQLFANRLAADIVESGKSLLGGQQEQGTACRQQPLPVGERRRGFKQSRPGSGRSQSSLEQQESVESLPGPPSMGNSLRCPREVPLIHIEPDQRDEASEDGGKGGRRRRESPPQIQPQSSRDRAPVRRGSSDREKVVSVPTVPPVGVEGERRSLSASSEESGSGSWAQVAPDDDPQEETSSFIQLSEGNGNSSTSSLGFADLEGYGDFSLPSGIISEEREKRSPQRDSQEQVDERMSGLSAGTSGFHREVVVMNIDLEEKCVDVELRAALQWIAASELGMPTLSLRKEDKLVKFPRIVQLASQKAWHVGDLFSAVAQYCQLHQEEVQRGRPAPSLFDWLLETHR
ncbi:A-kinase anchor protein SPHKAP [Chanos chanos]|uniref:A-kinase anchor protein SPHKAP n=1 Tax=Chanos chanos TaxID=29144 RepID=A0A6J2ULY7_CHACN|nr:A-kinase anchor protein SPHKAP [Chanos chanos]